MATLGDPSGYALHCDEYELTMSQSFLANGQTGLTAFEMSVRALPVDRGYLVAAGLATAAEYLRALRFDESQLAWLASTDIYEHAFLEHLRALRFSGDLDGLPEGTPVGARTPLLRVTAPRIEATLVESALLAIVNHQTLIATKAARVVDAAQGRPVWDFSLRRVHGPDAAVGVARAAFIAGCAGTATVVAGQRLGIPTTGTMAHHYVLAFGPDGEEHAFAQFLRDWPGRAVLLVDTYDTLRGTERAIGAARSTGVPLSGVRLDSGDLAGLAGAVRARLDAAEMTDTRIVASNDLDEHRIAALLGAGAPIDSFGVGTMLGTSADAPALGGVFKLVAQEERAGAGLQPVMKCSSGKQTDPGVHQVFRQERGDVIGLDDERLAGRRLLQPVLRRGQPVGDEESLVELQHRCLEERAALPEAVRRLRDPQPWPVRRSPGLEALRRRLGVSDAELAGGTAA